MNIGPRQQTYRSTSVLQPMAQRKTVTTAVHQYDHDNKRVVQIVSSS